MSKKFSMKHTNGKKSDMTKFPFKTGGPKPGDTPLEAFSGETALQGAGKGAAMGAAIGSIVPGVGTVVGGVVGGAIGGVAGGITGGRQEEEEARLMEQSEKDAIVAQKLKETKIKNQQRESIGYSGGFEEETT